MAVPPITSALSLAAVSRTPSTASSLSPGLSSPSIRFTTVVKLFDEIGQTVGDILTINGVSVQDFAEIEEERKRRGRRFRLRRFSARSKILIITIPTAVHERLHLCLHRSFLQQLSRALDASWIAKGSTTFRVQGHPSGDGGNGDGGEGDSSGGPKPQRYPKEAWPTLVIEAGDSETLEELRTDMRWWFNASEHQVKIVLLAKFDHSHNQIILEKWVEVQALPQPGATTARAVAQAAVRLAPDCSQVITVTRNPGITATDPTRWHPTSYTVTRGALRLDFDRLFLRQPGQGEGDIIISTQDLQNYAADVWEQL